MTTIFITKASDGAHSVRLSSHDTYIFKMMIEALKGYIPACNRVYVPDRKTWRVDAYAHDCLQGWLSYARTTFSAQVQWSGSAADADPEAEWTPPPPRQKVVDPYQTLHLLPSAPPELIRAAFKCLATIFHPDKPGGDEERMKAINRAYEKLAA
jgi:hypothetical protein